MKKAIFGLVVLILIFTASCNKTPAGGGSWTFLGLTYNATSCVGLNNYLAATNSSNTNSTYFGGLTVFFPGSTLPTTTGTYTVVDTIPTGNQVTISASVGGAADTTYTAIGGGQTVAVTVSKGKVSVSGSNIQLQNTSIKPGTYPVTFNIHTD